MKFDNSRPYSPSIFRSPEEMDPTTETFETYILEEDEGSKYTHYKILFREEITQEVENYDPDKGAFVEDVENTWIEQECWVSIASGRNNLFFYGSQGPEGKVMSIFGLDESDRVQIISPQNEGEELAKTIKSVKFLNESGKMVEKISLQSSELELEDVDSYEDTYRLNELMGSFQVGETTLTMRLSDGGLVVYTKSNGPSISDLNSFISNNFL